MCIFELLPYSLKNENLIFFSVFILYQMGINIKVILLFFLLFKSSFGLKSQTNDINDIQYGFGIKTTIDLNFQYPNYNIAFTSGIGGHPFDYAEVFPSIHTGFLIYNKGDLISSYSPAKGFFRSTLLDIFLDLSLTVGYYTPNTNFDKRFVPLYHFSDFTPNPLQNPFQHSLTVGTNFIWFFEKYKTKTKELPQQVGFTGLMVDRRVQASTYNDGSIWAKSKLGDGLDRYYTGGGLITYHSNIDKNISKFEVSFHKFTGHEKYAFDTANLLQIDFIPFKNEETYYYSKSRFRFTATSFKNNGGFHLTLHNTDRDPQDWIHFKGSDTYHPDIFKDRKGFWNEFKRMGLGGFWFYREFNFTN